MSNQEKKIVIIGVLLTSLASAGFAMSQGNIGSEDAYKSQPEPVVESISEKELEEEIEEEELDKETEE